MIDASTLPLGTPIYTFVENGTGKNTHIAVTLMREWVTKNSPKLEKIAVPCDHAKAQEWVRDNIVSMDRVGELIKRGACDPGIMCHDGGYTDGRADCMYVDGHHRYVANCLRGFPLTLCYLLREPLWRPFEIKGHVELTQEQLKAIPITKRNY